MIIYDFKMKDSDGNMVDLKDYNGKVLLVVNTATQCGLTPTYEPMVALYEKYQSQGLEILDFPCNQFGQQAPGTDKEVADFFKNTFGAKHKIFAKVEVNGENACDLYKYLKGEKGFAGFDKNHKLYEILDDINRKLDPKYEESSEIKWNFTKFLIDRDGKVVARFEPTSTFESIEESIKKLI